MYGILRHILNQRTLLDASYMHKPIVVLYHYTEFQNLTLFSENYLNNINKFKN